MTTAKLKQPKLPVPIATDIALHVATKDGHAVPLSYWDVWYALLTQDQFGGDLEQLAQALRAMSKGCPSSEDAKRKLSHLRDFQQRLTSSEVSLAEVVAAISPELAKTEARRAHGRIVKHNQRSYELSEPMRLLPEERLYNAAIRGMCGGFPVSPAAYYEALRAKFNWRRCYEEDASWDLAKKLDVATAAAANLAKNGKFAEALATLRSAMTVTLELAQIADDSFGCIGMSFQSMFEAYLALPRDKAGIAPEAFLMDLLELLIFEDYGFTADHTDGFFASLSREEGLFGLAHRLIGSLGSGHVHRFCPVAGRLSRLFSIPGRFGSLGRCRLS